MEINEMIATVQVYIKCRKDIDVDISIRQPSDVSKLYLAYTTASQWLRNNTDFYR